jgi:SAM-dependent methyltransferase
MSSCWTFATSAIVDVDPHLNPWPTPSDSRHDHAVADIFGELVAEAEAAPVSGWGFSWLDGRATEQRPSWGYQRLISCRLPAVRAALDVQTGGGEVLAGVPDLPPLMAATESWPPNVAKATQLLHPRGVVVVVAPDEPPLPFGDDAFDLVISRHPVTTWWTEIARVLRPGGSYLAQHVGPASVVELIEFFLGRQPEEVRRRRHPDEATMAAEAAGLEVTDLRAETLRLEFFDVGAVVYFLRKVIWIVPGFTVDRYRDRLADLHEQIQAEGPFVAYSTRFLIEARTPE